MSRINSLAELEELRKGILSKRDPDKPCITLCSGSACHATGSREVAASLEEEIQKQGLSGKVDIRRTGCHGFCERGPIIVIHPDKICYFQIEPKDVPEIITETIKGKKIIERLLYDDPDTKEKIIHESEIPFYKHQTRIVLRNCGHIDPEQIEDYINVGGYTALKKSLTQLKPEEIFEEVLKSSLRCRGGAGFPAG